MLLFLLISHCFVTFTLQFMKYRPISVRKAVGIYQNRLLDLSQGIIKKSLSCTAVPVDIESKLEQSIVSELQSSAVPEFATLLLCVSGGSDSIALLHLMNAIKRRKMPQLDLKVVNFNHKQRIEADEEVISLLCPKLSFETYYTGSVCISSCCKLRQ